MSWFDYRDTIGANGDHSVVGKLRLLPALRAPQLNAFRDLLVYLPPSYDGHHAYPVLYMQDGQNLFDRATSYSGEWEVDETMEMLAREDGIEAIVVGIPNGGMERLNEYSPFVDAEMGGGKGDAYLNWVVETVKPLIDASFNTLPDRDHTAIIGSSMGGLISLYGFLRHPDVFGLCASMSGAYWFAEKAIIQYTAEANVPVGRIYLDSGTGEKSSPGPLGRIARCFCDDVQMVQALLIEKGFEDTRDVWYVQEVGGIHSEAVWARRLPWALRFLFNGTTHIE